MPTKKYFISKSLTSAVLLCTSFFVNSSAFAYLTVGESAEVLPQGQYQFGGELQALTNEGGGLNVSGFFDAPIDESTSGRVSLGVGAVDFAVGASVKYVPFPDVDQQPAMGVRFGVSVARDAGNTLNSLQVAPLISKKVESDVGLWIPYAAIPINLVNAKSENYIGTQIALGSEWLTPDLPEARFGGEVVFSLNRSYSSIAGYVTIPFESSRGLKRRR
ncbi:MAG: hypothetical protein ACOYOK_05300 [Pseudobdellovibrionaceae bacterium]